MAIKINQIVWNITQGYWRDKSEQYAGNQTRAKRRKVAQTRDSFPMLKNSTTASITL
jgi:hypothetical protein